ARPLPDQPDRPKGALNRRLSFAFSLPKLSKSGEGLMTSLELCRQPRAQEIAKFVKVLKPVPEGRPDYRPDPRSRTAAELAWLLAQSEAALLKLIEAGEIQWSESKAPTKLDAIVSAYETSAKAVNEGIATLDEGSWDKKVRFIMEGAAPWEDTLGAFVWGFLF